MYHSMQNQSWYLVKADGSGTGVQYFESTGTVSNVYLDYLLFQLIQSVNQINISWRGLITAMLP